MRRATKRYSRNEGRKNPTLQYVIAIPVRPPACNTRAWQRADVHARRRQRSLVGWPRMAATEECWGDEVGRRIDNIMQK